jgi:hypothetical protein
VGNEIYGLTLPELPQGTMPLRAVMIVEILTPQGVRLLLTLSTDDVQTWEAAGMAAFLDESSRTQMKQPPAG